MNLSTEITLWSISLSLATFGSIFGIIAAVNSKKANKKLTELIATTWITEESEKLFFYNIKNILKENVQTLSALKEPNCTYHKYNQHGAYTRLNPVSKVVITSLKNTEFSELMDFYIKCKKKQDEEFALVIDNNFEILNKRIKIDIEMIEKLIKYHKHINLQSKLIMRKYVEATQ